MNKAAIFLLAVLACTSSQAEDIFSILQPGRNYFTRNGELWAWRKVPYTSTYCGSCYTSYRWESYRVEYQQPKKAEAYVAADPETSDERFYAQILQMVDDEKSRQAKARVLGYLGIQGLFADRYALQAPNGFGAGGSEYAYPSAAGNTRAGFIEYNRHSFSTPLDVNRIQELAALNNDTFTRSMADQTRRAQEGLNAASALQSQALTAATRVAEADQLRQSLAVATDGLAKLGIAIAQMQKEARPADSESETYRAGSPTVNPGTPQVNDVSALLKTYCGKCHGQGNGDRMEIYGAGQKLTELQAQTILIRLDPGAPDGQGKPFRMPPPAEPQPTPQERELMITTLRKLIQ